MRRPTRRVLSDISIALAAVLVVISSFLPWYRIGWTSSDDGVDTYVTNDATAWSASTGWSIAVLLAVTAGTTQLTFTAMRRSRWLRWLPSAGAAVALLLAIGTWREITPLSPGISAWTTDDGITEFGAITKDQLHIYHVDGFDMDVVWGLHFGLAALTFLTAVLVIAAASAVQKNPMSPRRPE